MAYGTVALLALLLSSKGYEVTAVDWAVTMMQKAIDKANAASLPIKFDVQDAERLSFADASFDAVVSRHVLWTLADPAKAAKECRGSRPGLASSAMISCKVGNPTSLHTYRSS